MSKLSVVIITFNEEKKIGRCIDSVRSIANEIIVVDSFSTDNTEKICKERKVKFIKHRFEGYIEQKNFALSFAKYPYVLCIDADEVLSERLAISIAEATENFNADGYTMNRLTNYCGKWIKHCGWYPDRKLRIVNRNSAVWTGVNPHDKLVLYGKNNIKHLKGDLLHYSYDSISDHIKQMDMFSQIAANELFKQGKSAGFFKVIFKAKAIFIKSYFIKLGFLDGFYGLVVCFLSAVSTFLKYSKLKELNDNKTLMK
ncbi:MAG: glycosyltransferase family 2 protein [Bacteroidales bacterium]|nr:glycosyltransferase family 2 protein [Bacteroidales bacterium]